MELEDKLASDLFDSANYIKEVACEYDSGDALRQHKKQIQALAEQTAQKLKQNVYQNYALFIDTSKEISSLETEMYQLNHLLHEHEVLTHKLQALSVPEEKAIVQDDSNDQQEMHSIASLLETVEGCSSVTEVPGRYLVYSSHLVELDQESCEAVQLIRAFLLNDSLMIATHTKKRRGPVRYRFQALFELDNMAVVDVSDSDAVQNAFKVHMFPDSHFYQAESSEAKVKWVSVLESTKQKYKATHDTIKPETDVTASVKKSLSGNAAAQKQAVPIETFKDAPEQLDVFVAQRDFEKAILKIEDTKDKLKNYPDSHALRDIRVRLNHRINQLSEILMKELDSSHSGSLRGGPRAAGKVVKLLLRLGRSAKACELFLKNHSQIIDRELADVRSEGAVTLYISKYSSVFFHGLENAADEFLRAFGEHSASYSSFVVWCSDQMGLFTRKSISFIFDDLSTLSLIAECVKESCAACAELTKIGLDLTFILYNSYVPHLSKAITTTADQVIQFCTTSSEAENWMPQDFSKDQPKLEALEQELEILKIKEKVMNGCYLDLTALTVEFCKRLLSFVTDSLGFYVPQLYTVFFKSFGDMFHHIVKLHLNAARSEKHSQDVDFIHENIVYLVGIVLLTVGKKIKEKLGFDAKEIVELHDQLQSALDEKWTTPGDDGDV